MEQFPIISLNGIEVWGIPVDLVCHLFVGFCIAFFLMGSGAKPRTILGTVIAAAVLKEFFDWYPGNRYGATVPGSILDIAASIAGALAAPSVESRFRISKKSSNMPNQAAQNENQPAQPPLVISDRSAIDRARNIVAILRKDKEKKSRKRAA